MYSSIYESTDLLNKKLKLVRKEFIRINMPEEIDFPESNSIKTQNKIKNKEMNSEEKNEKND